MPLKSNTNDENKLNTSINTTTEISTANGTDTLKIDKNGNNVVVDNLLKLTQPENLLGTKKNGQPRAVYDVVKDTVSSLSNNKKKKKKNKKKNNGYSFLLDIKGKKKKHKKKKNKKNKKFSKILGF